LGGEFFRANTAEAVADGEHVAGKLEDARDRAAGVGVDHAREREVAVGLDRVAALIGRDAAKAHGVFAAGQLDLHLIEHHLRRFFAIELGIDRFPATFEGWAHSGHQDGRLRNWV